MRDSKVTKMKRLLLLLPVLATALLGAMGIASAQYYYGPGYYEPPPPPPPPYYRHRYYERDYDEPRYYRRDEWRYVYERERYARPGPGGKCPRGYSVQDGFCKPYTGR